MREKGERYLCYTSSFLQGEAAHGYGRPLSRAQYPKQFLKLLGDFTLLQQTVLQVNDLMTPERLLGGHQQRARIYRARTTIRPPRLCSTPRQYSA